MSKQLPGFGKIQFAGKLRPSQAAAVKLIKPELGEGSDSL